MIQLVKEHEDDADGFVIACQDDPNLDMIKELTTRSVVGIADASMKIASMLDGVACGLIIAGGLIRYGVSTSRIGRYRGPHPTST
jgi:Asp/Glu/hydantoin racemase